jgi:hypothetical protein
LADRGLYMLRADTKKGSRLPPRLIQLCRCYNVLKYDFCDPW